MIPVLPTAEHQRPVNVAGGPFVGAWPWAGRRSGCKPETSSVAGFQADRRPVRAGGTSVRPHTRS